jgi:uncharacterized protein (TIGR02453 family)
LSSPADPGPRLIATQVGFAGFPRETLRFLADVRANNTRTWFEEHRDDYERFYVEPAKEFVAAAAVVLGEIAPGVRAEPRILGSIFRITLDTRFSKDKRPYKDHLDFWFWEGERRHAVSGFFARITPDFVGIGAGCHGFNPDQLAAYRAALEDPAAGADLVRVAGELETFGYQLGGGGSPTTRSQAGGVNPRARLKRHRTLFVHIDAPVDAATNGVALLETCRRHWRQLAPLHRWLVDHVQNH